MSYIDDDLNPIDVVDESVESLLDSLSLDTVRTNIEQQIDGSVSPNRNFLGVVLSKFQMIKENKVDPDDIKELNNEMIEFCAGLVGRICSQFSLGIDPSTDDSMEYLDILQNLYTFFVTNREYYVKEFVLQYILQNKKYIVDSLDIGGKGTDVTSIAYRKRNLGKYDVAILANINAVMDYVKDSIDIGPEEFLTTIDDGDYTVNEVLGYFQSGILAGNFVRMYVDSVVDERSSDSALQIRNDIRMELLQNAQGGY